MLGVIESIKTRAERDPLAPAFFNGMRIVTYADVFGGIGRVANFLSKRGVKPGTKVFLNVGDADIRIIVTLACLHSAIVPFVLREIGDLKDEVDHDLVIATAQPADPKLKNDIVLDNALFASGCDGVVLPEEPRRAESDLLFVSTTTGTTGRRKLIADLYGIHRIRNEEQEKAASRRVESHDRCLATVGDISRYGLWMTLQNLRAGATTVRGPADNVECLKIVNLVGVNHISTTPDTASSLMDTMDGIGARCPSVRAIRLSGSLVPPALVARLEKHFAATIAIGYGTTEAGRITSGEVSSATFEPGFVGAPHPEIEVVGAGTPSDPQPVVIVNRNTTYSPFYAAGVITPVPAVPYTLPDLGYMKNGNLYLVGRSDEVFNADGNKVAFSVIENAIRGLAGVKDVGIVSGTAVEEPLGLLVAVAGTDQLNLDVVTERVWRTAQANTARRHIRVFRVATVARNSFGKVDRQGVAQAYREQLGGSSTVG
ncbi:MAG: AMP-binding protein [Bauldia sp.]